MTCGFVLVSHSLPLAEATRDLALQMANAGDLPLAIAAGTDDGGLGTDAMAVLAALEDVGERADDVLVFVDLGSAIMSTQTALEFADPDLVERVHISRAPFVEGVVGSAAKASAGRSWQKVEREARRGLMPKEALVEDALATPEAQPTAEPVAEAAAPATKPEPATPEAPAPAPVDPFSPTLPRLEFTLAINPEGYTPAPTLEEEVERFEVARARACATLEQVAQSYDGTMPEGAATVAEVLRTLVRLINDRRLATTVTDRLSAMHRPNAYTVIEKHLEGLAGKMSNARTDILREQAVDVRLITRLILGALAGDPLAGVANGREVSSPCVFVLPELDALTAALLRPGAVTGVEIHSFAPAGHGQTIAQILGVPLRGLED
ncbi:MAG: dihydroxyacetone kinase phosphoryl donor subunit DhaM [Actinomycetaceae bacterium]|nr:dihydroxyacetone kinase phosphoryl donor subunit DhaM [Actinomycetaceae bacterium]MDU0971132.1 dihydroxyacetone kinase phosphoryl donor subunit DhaM [Actinomycetaceae bacterium]